MYDKLTVMDMATRQMDWLAQRTEVVAQNIANADTPGYTPKDLKPLDFKGMVAETEGAGGGLVTPTVTAVATDPRHIVPQSATPPNTVTQSTIIEASPDGNAVDVENQSRKLGDAKIAFQTAASLYAKQVSLLKLAIMGHE